jgi:uncharacterized protein YndB with AHSA1/START domain
MKREGKGTVAGDTSGLVGAGVSDAAVRKATGKGWGEWFDLLDAVGARAMCHQQIIAEVVRHGPGDWWQQMISTAYEQARSLRERHQGEEGFAANASKVIKAGVTRVYEAWTQDDLRAGWLDCSGWHVRKATPCKSLRITWKDGRTHLEVALWPRGVGKTLIQVEHNRLPTLEEVHRSKAFWSLALERLRELLETADQPHSLAA